MGPESGQGRKRHFLPTGPHGDPRIPLSHADLGLCSCFLARGMGAELHVWGHAPACLPSTTLT